MDFLTNATDQQLAGAVETNGVECCLSWADWKGMDRYDSECLTWTLTDVPFPFFNNAFYPNMPDSEVDRVVDDVLQAARRRKVPMFWWTGPLTKPSDLGERLLKKGFVHGFEAPAMAVDLREMTDACHVPPGFEIREVTDESMIRDWCGVMAPVYEFPDFAAQTWQEILSYLGLGPDKLLRHYVGYLDNRPVASSSLFFNSGVAGVSSVATVPASRGQGIGKAITVEPLREARRLGYHYGVLFSSPMGMGIYKSIGFREYGKGGCYLWVDG